MLSRESYDAEDRFVPCTPVINSSEDISQQFCETNHTTVIKIYKLNYAAMSLFLACFTVIMITVTCLWKGRRVRNLKPPAFTVYYLCKTANKNDHYRLCKALIEEEDYDVNYTNADVKLSLFLCACSSGNADLISFMLKRGANIHGVSSDNDSAFYLACCSIMPSSSDFKILDILLSAGSDINLQNVNGFAALHLACARGHLLLVKYLLQNGADPKVHTFNGVLPLRLALTNNHIDVAKYIQCKVEEKNS